MFRISEAEFLRLAQKAAASDMGVNEFARLLTLSREAQIEIQTCEKADPALISQLGRIGNNLNQLVHNAHIFGRVSPKVEELCEQIEQIIDGAADMEIDE